MAAYVRNDARAIIRHAQSHSRLWWWYVVWGSVIVSIALLRVHLVTNLLGSPFASRWDSKRKFIRKRNETPPNVCVLCQAKPHRGKRNKPRRTPPLQQNEGSPTSWTTTLGCTRRQRRRYASRTPSGAQSPHRARTELCTACARPRRPPTASPHTVRLTDNLVVDCGLDKHMTMVRSGGDGWSPAPAATVRRYHTDAYVAFLEKIELHGKEVANEAANYVLNNSVCFSETAWCGRASLRLCAPST